VKRIVFKAQLGDGPVQEVGGYEFLPDEWEEELADFDGSEAAWLQNRGVDWAYEAVRSDTLRYWAEVEPS
jgi:hypothetical protein